MSLFDTPHAIELTDDVLEEMRLSNPDGQLIEIKPYKESDRGLDDNIEMYKAFHNRKGWHGFNTSPTNSFEIWFDGDNVRFLMYIDDESHLERSVNHITSNFPSARISFPRENNHDIRLPNVDEHTYVAGAHFDLAMHFFAPIRNPNGVNKFYGQYRNIVADMTNQKGVTEVIQVLFKPAGTGWTSSYWNDAGEFAEDISQGPPGELDDAAKNIKSQIGQQGFYIALRVLCFGDDEETVLKQRDDLGMAFNQYYREYTGQTFVPIPHQGYELQRLCNEVSAREGRHMDWPGLRHLRRLRNGQSCETIIMTLPELAGLAHIPNQNHLDNSAVDWVMLDSSNRLPAQAPKYEDSKRAVNKDTVPWASNTVDPDEIADATGGTDDTEATPDNDGSDDDTSEEEPPEANVPVEDTTSSDPSLPEGERAPELPDAPEETPPALDDGAADEDSTTDARWKGVSEEPLESDDEDDSDTNA